MFISFLVNLTMVNPESLNTSLDTVPLLRAKPQRLDLRSLTHTQAQGENRKVEAAAEKDLSHATAKAGPFTTTATGGVAKDDPNRTAGSWNQNVGALKESIGGFVGAEGLK